MRRNSSIIVAMGMLACFGSSCQSKAPATRTAASKMLTSNGGANMKAGIVPTHADANLSGARVATKRHGPADHDTKFVIDGKKHVLLHLTDSKAGHFRLYTGAMRLAKDSSPNINGDGSNRSVRTTTAPAPATVMSEDGDGEATLLPAWPFFDLINGFAFIAGNNPVAEAAHVIAGSESTQFALVVVNGTSSDPTQIRYRVYAIDAPNGVNVSTIDDSNKIDPNWKRLDDGYWVEVSYDQGASAWTMSDEHKIVHPDISDAIQAKAKAENAADDSDADPAPTPPHH